MRLLMLIYNDPTEIAAVPQAGFDTRMHGCFKHADTLRADGTLLESQQLHDAEGARTVRIRDGRTRVVDGPFAETKELLGGNNIVEAASSDEAVRIASEFPWARTGGIEVRAISDIDAEQRRVGA